MEANVIKEKPVIVLGSKPNAAMPDVEPRIVVAANGAAELAVTYRDRYGAEIVSMVPGRDLFEQEHIRVSIKKSVPDKLLLLGTVHIENDPLGYVEKELGIAPESVTIVSLHERNWGLTRRLGWRRYIIWITSSLVRGLRHLCTVAIPDLFGKRNFNWMSRSTGLNAILYSLDHFSGSDIVIAGIGLQAGSHFNSAGVFKAKTARMDRLTMKYWLPQKRINLYTTDPILSELGKVSKWEGPTF
jgi:hypothetical protein